MIPPVIRNDPERWKADSDRSDARDRIAALVTRFEEGRTQYASPSYNETDLRVEFLDPLFRLLGWDVGNESGRPIHLREVVREASVEIEDANGFRKKRPDYEFRVGTERLFFLEAKRPSVSILEDPAPAFQLRRYGWSGNLSISVLSNFEDICIFDCSIRPVGGDAARTALLARFHCSEYASRFDEIAEWLSRDSAVAGHIPAAVRTQRRPFRPEPFDQYFLKQIEDWRLALGRDLAANNPGADAATLDMAVQRILDRIVFLRFCEDRELERRDRLRGVDTFAKMRERFREADRKWDSGLFAMLEEDRLVVSDEVLSSIFRNLYWPESPYEFGVVDPYIIDQIYEEFLSKSLAVDSKRHVSLVEKPEAVDAQGAVVTPKRLADIVVERTLEPLVTGKTTAEVLELRVADICCGAGNFLVSAYEFLLRKAFAALDADPESRRKAVRDRALIPVRGGWKVSFEVRRSILLQCIHGVDIDPLAVEISKFSLLLKLLEGVSSEEIADFRSRHREKALPNLDGNVRNGNSLVGMEFLDHDRRALRKQALLQRIKPFDFSAEFPFGGFSAIIGNPPYIRVQNLVRHSSEEYGFFKSNQSGYETAKSETLDKYALFVERALSLLSPGGRVGYVVPHKFMTNQAGDRLRGLLSRSAAVREIVHFGTVQVFKGRSTYPCILVLGNGPSPVFSVGFVRNDEELARFYATRDLIVTEHSSGSLSDAPWTFGIAPEKTVPADVLSRCRPLSDFADVFVGLQTSANDVFIFEATSADADFVHGVDAKGRPFRVERPLSRPCLYKDRINAYSPIRPKHFLLFPYRPSRRGPELVPATEMESAFPCAWEYLRRFKTELSKRNLAAGTAWYAFGRSQNIERFLEGEHLVWNVLSLGASYAFDAQRTAFTGGGNGPYYGLETKRGVRESILYLLALLQHGPAERMIENRSSHFRGDYYSHSRQFMKDLPVVPVDFGNAADRRAHDAIVAGVRRVLELRERAGNAGNSSSRATLERLAANEENDIARLVRKRYGFAPEKGAAIP